MKSSLDRQGLDTVAQAVVTGARGLGREIDRAADEVAALARSRLEALGAPGFQRVAHKTPQPLYRLRARYGDATLKQLLARVEKHLWTLASREETAHD